MSLKKIEESSARRVGRRENRKCAKEGNWSQK